MLDLAHPAMRCPNGRIYEMLDPCRFGGVGHMFSLPDLTVETDAWQPKILDAEHPIRSLERGVELHTVFHIADDHFRAKSSQLLRARLACIPRQRTYLPAFS